MKKGPSQMLELAVLALLRQGELHGYQIRKSLAEMAGPLFQFSFGSLYPALGRLEERGAVASFLESATDFIAATGSLTGDLALSSERRERSGHFSPSDRTGRTRRVYRITDIGEKLFEELFENAPLDSEADYLAWLYLADESRATLLAERTREHLAELEAKRRSNLRSRIERDFPIGMKTEIHRRLSEIIDSEIGFVRAILSQLDAKKAQVSVPANQLLETK